MKTETGGSLGFPSFDLFLFIGAQKRFKRTLRLQGDKSAQGNSLPIPGFRQEMFLAAA